VLQEEADRGWKASEIRLVREEKRLGCDLLSIPPDGGEPHPVEVKGWGESFLDNSGSFRGGQDIRPSQMESAIRNSNFRVEIVANLNAFLRGDGPYERLTLTAAQIRVLAVPRQYDVPLTGMENQIRRTDPMPGSERKPMVSEGVTHRFLDGNPPRRSS
jgi:hypothetical protein